MYLLTVACPGISGGGGGGQKLSSFKNENKMKICPFYTKNVGIMP